MENVNYIEKLKCKYKYKLIDSKKTPEEIKLYLESNFKVKLNDALTKTKYSRLIRLTELNCLNSIKGKGLSKSDLSFIVFEIAENEDSSKYYLDLKNNMYLNQSVCIVLDMTTGYLESNSDLLRRELYLYQGINKYDIENNTFDLITYLLLLEEDNS